MKWFKQAVGYLFRVVVAIPKDNAGSWIPDIEVWVYIFGVCVFHRLFQF